MANPFTTPPNTRIYAVGDIHGMADKLTALHAQIQADAKTFTGQKILIHMGDYVDRGPKSKQVIETLSTLNWPAWQVINLIGNHDWKLRAFIDIPEDHDDYMEYPWDGNITLRSYGVPIAHTTPPQKAAAQLAQVMPAHHREFLNNLTATVQYGDYIFTHAGGAPEIPPTEQDLYQLMFRTPLEGYTFANVCLVHGHTKKSEPEVTAKRICTDTGAYQPTGKLTAVVLENDNVRFLQA